MKRNRLWILAFVLLLLAVLRPMEVSAATEDYYTYTVTGGEATITDVSTGISGDITVPSQLGGYPVTVIGASAFEGCTGLTGVIVPDCVTTIGKGAFSGCSALKSITIPFVGENRNVSEKDNQYPFGYIFGSTYYAGSSSASQYYYCPSSSSSGYLTSTYYVPTALKSVTVTGGDLPYGAFHNCTVLTSVTLGDGVGIIGKYAFYRCSVLKDVTIGSGVTTIEEYAFQNCSALKTVTIPDNVITVQASAFTGCTGLESITIPFVGRTRRTSEDLAQYPFGYIFGTTSYTGGTAAKQTYYGHSLSNMSSTTYYIPTSLKSVTVTGGELLYGAFYNCSGLTTVTLKEDVENIGRYAFYNCTGMTNLTVLGSITSVGENAFKNCSALKKVDIKDIGAWSEVSIYSSTSGPLSYTQELYVDGQKVTDLILPEGTAAIGEFAFSGCKALTGVTIPDSVETIGRQAFSNCTGLTSVTFEGGYTTVGSSAFYNCTAITEVHIQDMAAWCETDFIDSAATPLSYTQKLYVDGEETTDLVIPEGTTRIGSRAFNQCKILTGVTIPDSVTDVGGYAFSGCTNLTKLTIGKGVATIGEQAFRYCSIQKITVPGSVKEIGSAAFADMDGLTDVIMEDGVENIESYAFSRCHELINVTIGEGIKKIGDVAFYECSDLTNMTIGSSVEYIGSDAFYLCGSLDLNVYDNAGYLGNAENPYLVLVQANSYTIPSCTVHEDTSVISSIAFANCTKLTNVSIPDGVVMIGRMAFCRCTALTEVVVPDSVNYIAPEAFDRCTGLVSITLPFVGDSRKSHTEAYQYPFGHIFGTTSWSGCVATKQSFYGESLTSTTSATYYIPATLKSVTITGGNITHRAFDSCAGLTDVTLSEGVTSVGNSVFYNCTGLTNVSFPNTLNSIGNSLFSGCTSLIYNTYGDIQYLGNSEVPYLVLVKAASTDITDITIHEDTKFILDSACNGCTGLTEVTIPDGVVSIGTQAFCNCSALTEVTIGEGLTQINQSAFYNCSALTNVTFGKNVRSILNAAFNGCERLEAVVFPENLETIGYSAFNRCSALTEITIPDSVVTIDEYAFGSCASVKTVILGDGLTEIERNAFAGCTALTDVVFGNNLTKIGSVVFGSCTSLEEITIPDSVKHFDSNLFWDCTNLKKVNVGNGLEAIGHSTFSGCVKLTDVTIGDGVTSLGSQAFQNCSSLTKLAVGRNLEVIEHDAFEGCTALRTVTIPDSVTSIQSYAFDDCTGLTDVYYCGTEDQWKTINTSYSNDPLINANIHYNCCYHRFVGPICTICGQIDAAAGETAQLSADVTLEEMTIPAGVTLDLNGCHLTAEVLVSFGDIIDTVGTGGLTAGTLVLADNSYLPIYDTTGSCYRFYAWGLRNLGVRGAGNSVTFGFALDFADPAAYALLARTEDPRLNITTDLAWGDEVLTFAFSPELIRAYASLQGKHPGVQAALLLNVTGLEALDSGTALTATFALAPTPSKTAQKADPMTYTCG